MLRPENGNMLIIPVPIFEFEYGVHLIKIEHLKH